MEIKKQPTLGRGLSALLANQNLEIPAKEDHNEPAPKDMETLDNNSANATKNISLISVQDLSPLPNQPRQHFPEGTLKELARSIQSYGILQPLLVCPVPRGTGYWIIAGERRWRAAKLAGLQEIPCIIRLNQEHPSLELALIENIQREELSCVEEAKAFQQLITDYHYSHENLAEKIGKDRATITNSIRLLALPTQILNDLQDKRLSAGHGKCLCSLEDPKLQLRARDIIITKKFSVRQTEELVKSLKENKKIHHEEKINPDLRHLCDQFKGHLGTKVKIAGDSNRGKIEICYYSREDLERVADLVLNHN